MLGESGDVPELECDIGPYKGPYEGMSSKVEGVANFFGVSEIPRNRLQPGNIGRTSPNASEAMLIGGPLRDNPDKASAASAITYTTPNDRQCRP